MGCGSSALVRRPGSAVRPAAKALRGGVRSAAALPPAYGALQQAGFAQSHARPHRRLRGSGVQEAGLRRISIVSAPTEFAEWRP